MHYSIDQNKPLCYSCKYYITIFGAHRGGVYCQYCYPQILYHFVNICPYYENDSNKIHKRMYNLEDYPKLIY